VSVIIVNEPAGTVVIQSPAAGTIVVTPGGGGGGLPSLAGHSVLGRTPGSSGDAAAIVATELGQVLRRGDDGVEFGPVDLESDESLEGVLPPAHGGVGSRYALRDFFSSGRRSWFRWPILGGASTHVVGATTTAPNGTISNAAGTADGVFQQWTQSTPGVSRAGGALFNVLDGQVQRQWRPTVLIRFQTPSSLANSILHVGLAGNINSGSSDQSDQHVVALRHSVPAGDSGWRTCVANGSAQSLGTAFGSIATSTVYTMAVDFRPDANEAIFYLGSPDAENMVEVARVSSGLPSDSQALLPWLSISSAIGAPSIHFGHSVVYSR